MTQIQTRISQIELFQIGIIRLFIRLNSCSISHFKQSFSQ
jgi:hypothetical protein